VRRRLATSTRSSGAPALYASDVVGYRVLRSSHARDARTGPLEGEKSIDRIRLIELIEGQTARLSAEGRGLWEELEFLRESIPDPEEQDRMARKYDIMERIFDLPVAEQFLTSRLAELVAALRRAEEAERRGKPGDDHRARGVINAAMLKDSEEGQQTDPHMTLGRAIARLEEHD
jgi:hypothetical protein